MKVTFALSMLLVLALGLSACGSAAANQGGGINPGSSGGFSGSGSGASGQFAPVSGLALAAGMIKLDGTPYAVTPQEASKLLPLWKQLGQAESSVATSAAARPTPTPGGTPQPGFRFDPAMLQQVASEVAAIEKVMPSDQLQAIQTMNLNRQDIATILQQANIQMGNFDNGTPQARFDNGGTFTPPNGTPRPFGTPGAFRSGARGAFASFIPPTVVQGVIEWLQTKAGSS